MGPPHTKIVFLRTLCLLLLCLLTNSKVAQIQYRHSDALGFHADSSQVYRFDFEPLADRKNAELLFWLQKSHAIEVEQEAEITVNIQGLTPMMLQAHDHRHVASVLVKTTTEDDIAVTINNETNCVHTHEKPENFWSEFKIITLRGKSVALTNMALAYYNENQTRQLHVEWNFENSSMFGNTMHNKFTALKVKHDPKDGRINNGLIKGVQWRHDKDELYLLRQNQYQAEGNLYANKLNSLYFDDEIKTCQVQRLNTEVRFECEKGYYKDELDSCQKCQKGKYKSVLGNEECQECPAQLGTIKDGSIKCERCPSGRYLDTKQSHCFDCKPGSYRRNTDSQEECIDCPAGKYSPYEAATSESMCQMCPNGTFSRDSGIQDDSLCDACPQGEYSIPNRTTCNRCPVNKTTFGNGQGHSEDDCYCQKGFKRSAHTSQCEACGYGSKGTDINASFCVSCGYGEFQNQTGMSVCNTCASNQYSTYSAKECDTCPADSDGGFKNSHISNCTCNKGFTGQDGQSCLACSVGKFKNVSGSSDCEECRASTFQSEAGSTMCMACSYGKWSLKAAHICEACYSANTGGYGLKNWTECECTPGFFAIIFTDNEKQSPDCEPCRAGTYKTALGYNISCDNCPIGTYSKVENLTNASGCLPCSDTQFSPEGSSDCIECRAFSTSQNIYGTSSDCECNAGFFENTSKLCEGCSAGRFKQEIGNMACTGCPTGTASNKERSASVLNCLNCSRTEFAPRGSVECQACMPNAQSMHAKAAKTDCKCNGGFTARIDGQNCSVCERGTYKVGIGASRCLPCSNGKYSGVVNATSADFCLSCPKSTFAPQGSANCSKCQPFSDSWGDRGTKQTCKCNRGFTGRDGETCSGCIPGKFKIVIGDRPCSYCLTGTYSNKWNASRADTCKPAPKNSIVINNGTSFECSENYHQINSGENSFCLPTKMQTIQVAV